MKSKRGILFGSLILVFWIGVILYFSSQPSDESNRQSNDALTVYERLNKVFDFTDSKFFNRIESFVFEDLLDNYYTSSNSKIRKSAHVGIYFILGILASFFGWLYTKKWWRASLMGMLIPMVIAMLDEFIQGLIDRTSLLADVVLDSVSATIGMCCFMVLLAIYNLIGNYRTKQKPQKN